MFAPFRVVWRAIRRRAAWERDLEDELSSHLQHRIDHLVVAGLPREEAARRARLELGASEDYKERCREAHGLRWPDELRQDFRYAVRVLGRSPGFTAVAIISLALGIGANTVVFSVLRALVLAPLPVSSPNELCFVQGNFYPSQSYPNYRDIRDRNTSFSDLVAYRVAPMGVDAGGGARRVWGYLATGNYFDALGLRPFKGRFFHPEDDRVPNVSPLAVLSYACWQNRFQADPNIVGKTVRINSLPYTILGVAPRGFRGTELFYVPEIWVPMMMQPQIESYPWLDERRTSNCWVMGRLKRNVTLPQAEANVNAIAAALAREHPGDNDGLRITLARPGLVGDTGRRPTEAFVFGVMALAGLVLLAACANLASLLAARAADRRRELAIRLSIGAGRLRVVRQLLTEAIVVAIAGGAAGCALATVLLRLLSNWRMPLDFPIQFDVDPDARVFVFALVASLVTGVLFGIAPARQAWRGNPADALKGLDAASTGRRWAFRDLLLASQVALCCVLITAALVSLRGLSRALAISAGFEPRGVGVVAFDAGLARYSERDRRVLQRRALDAISRLPGVTAAAYASSIPLSLDQSNTEVFQENATDFRQSKAVTSNYYDISPGYFRAAGTRLAGRDFTWHDDAKAPKVAIVNETFARKLTGTAAAVGRRFRYGPKESIEIVGVVEDGKYTTLTEEPRAALFRPAAQSYNSTTVLIARSSLPEELLAIRMEQAIGALDPALPVYGAGSALQVVGTAFLPARAATVALGAFGALALMLVVTGIYGLASYTVSRRVREIGIRVAVGARPTQVLRFVLGRTALLLSIGSTAGLLLGIAAGQVLSSIVYQASPRDPAVLAGALATIALIGLAAAATPARRALSIDPLRALRHD